MAPWSQWQLMHCQLQQYLDTGAPDKIHFPSALNNNNMHHFLHLCTINMESVVLLPSLQSNTSTKIKQVMKTVCFSCPFLNNWDTFLETQSASDQLPNKSILTWVPRPKTFTSPIKHYTFLLLQLFCLFPTFSRHDERVRGEEEHWENRRGW